MRGFQRHYFAVLHSPFYRFAQLFALQVGIVAQSGFVLLFAVCGLIGATSTAMQSTLVRCLELGATNRAALFENKLRNVLVLITTSLAAVDATKHGQGCPAVLALGSASRLQAKVRLVALESLVAAPRTILVILTALHEEFCALWTLNLLRCPTEKIPHSSRFRRS